LPFNTTAPDFVFQDLAEKKFFADTICNQLNEFLTFLPDVIEFIGCIKQNWNGIPLADLFATRSFIRCAINSITGATIANIENVTNYTQDNLIIAATEPFSQYFDGSITWGPVNGRVVYAGMRFELK
jgi:hypothetical protein